MIKAIRLAIILAASIFIVFLYNPNIATSAVISEQINFIDNLNVDFNESASYLWVPENYGKIKSIKLNGKLKAGGPVKIYLEHENNSYLIFENDAVEKNYLEGTVEFVDLGHSTNLQPANKDENDLDASEELSISSNHTESKNAETGPDIQNNEENASEIESMISLNITPQNETINLIPAENSTKPLDEAMNSTSSYNETDIADAINETKNADIIIANKTMENKSITASLEYKTMTIYDIDDNGIETANGAADFTVENTDFNWDVNEENLCTFWETYSAENKEAAVCYGSQKCCNFGNLTAAITQWNEPFSFAFGKGYKDFNYTVSAKIMHVDFNVGLENPSDYVYYSDAKSLSSKLFQGLIEFEDICIESCILPKLDSASYNLVIEISNSGLILDSISYEILASREENNAPILVKNFTDAEFFSGKSHNINLSDFFYDPDNDTLFFNFYNNNNKISIDVINETATLSAAEFAGATYVFFTANDSINSAVSNIFKVEVKQPQLYPTGLKSLRNIIETG